MDLSTGLRGNCGGGGTSTSPQRILWMDPVNLAALPEVVHMQDLSKALQHKDDGFKNMGLKMHLEKFRERSHWHCGGTRLVPTNGALFWKGLTEPSIPRYLFGSSHNYTLFIQPSRDYFAHNALQAYITRISACQRLKNPNAQYWPTWISIHTSKAYPYSSKTLILSAQKHAFFLRKGDRTVTNQTYCDISADIIKYLSSIWLAFRLAPRLVARGNRLCYRLRGVEYVLGEWLASTYHSGQEIQPKSYPLQIQRMSESGIDPVMEGIRLILQYDVFISPEGSDADFDFDDYYSNIDDVRETYGNKLRAPPGFLDEAPLSALVDPIKEILASRREDLDFHSAIYTAKRAFAKIPQRR
ncbi:hypothetical protein DFS33DRAFT_1276251 [Desarmillaria ectypa]|nr:hypothetical protein DFS33DRAFT_1276251 [Desarmillaria ectypa]